MDQPDLGWDETERALTDLARVNRWLLGWSAAIRSFASVPHNGGFGRILDVGTGGGDVTAQIRAFAERQGGPPDIIGVDRKLHHLVHARHRAHLRKCVVAEVGALPFRDDSFDVAFSTLLLHHFDDAGSCQMVDELARVGDRALIVDLRRSGIARRVIRPLLKLLRVGRVAYYDGVVSVGQAWHLEDVERFAANLPSSVLEKRFPFRFSLLLGSERTSA